MSKQTYYNHEWEDPKIHPKLSEWITIGKDNKHFCCKVCNNGSLKCGTMGIGAPMNHMKPSKDPKNRTKHERNLAVIQGSHSISSLVANPTKTTNSDNKNDQVVATSMQASAAPSRRKAPFSSPAALKAEIVLAMESITSHISARSMEEFPSLMQYIFPDSQIAQQVQLKRTKLGYMVNYGLAPYYKEKAITSLKDACHFVSCFDESFNAVSNKKQLDVHIISFNNRTKLVERKYIGSSFFGHGHAEICLKNLLEVLHGLDYVNKLIQIGMDGPSVNWKLLNMIKENRSEQNPQSPKLLEIGSCGLHVIHGAFGTSESATDWNLKKFLKNCYSIFKKSPARRSDYLAANNLHSSHEGKDSSYLFPLKFCGHRWLENGKVISRIIEIFTYLQKYFQWLSNEKKMPKKDERFQLIQSYLSDPISPAILQFGLSVMEELEPFLVLFQAERPLAIFLYEKLKDLILSLVSRFVRTEIIQGTTLSKLIKLDFNESSHLLPSSSVDVGFGANGVLKKLGTLHSIEDRKFRSNAKTFFVQLISKLAERSPIKYPLTLYLSSLSPIQISSVSNELLKKRFNKLLQSLFDSLLISAKIADRAKVQYIKFIDNAKVIEQMKQFDVTQNRTDEFYMNVFSDLQLHTPELEEVIKLCLILSHGNARVESGFSINELIMDVNMKEESLVAQRIVYEGVTNEGGPLKADVNSIMMKSVRQASGRYKLALEENRQKQTEGEKKREARKRITKEINEATAAKKKALESLKHTISSYDGKIDNLKKKL